MSEHSFWAIFDEKIWNIFHFTRLNYNFSSIIYFIRPKAKTAWRELISQLSYELVFLSYLFVEQCLLFLWVNIGFNSQQLRICWDTNALRNKLRRPLTTSFGTNKISVMTHQRKKLLRPLRGSLPSQLRFIVVIVLNIQNQQNKQRIIKI